MDPRSTLIPARCEGLVNKIHAGECVLVLGPRIGTPTDVSAEQEPIDDYLARKLLEDLGDEIGGTVTYREALARYEQRLGAADVTVLTYGNLWRAEAGHTLRIELTNVDSPYLSPSRVPSVTTVTGVAMEIPIRR